MKHEAFKVDERKYTHTPHTHTHARTRTHAHTYTHIHISLAAASLIKIFEENYIYRMVREKNAVITTIDRR